MAASTRTVKVKFDGDAAGLKRAAQDGEKAVDGWRGKFDKVGRAAAGATLAMAAGAVVFGKDMLNLSRQIDLLDKKALTVFGDWIVDVEQWAGANAKAFGMTQRQVVALAANMADLLKPMGFTSEQAASMSTKMLDLAGALSQWSGGQRSAAEVSEILTKALLGEREELKSLGISITEADVQARLAAKGQKDLTGAALAQATALATQELILEKSTDAQAAWANGGKAAAEKAGALSSSIETMKEKLAVGLGPALETAVGLLTKFAEFAERHPILVGAFIGIAAALTILTAGVWAFNVAMAANPAVLIFAAVVVAVGLLVAALVWAWQNSETFRNIVKGAFLAAQFGIDGAVRAIRGILNWFGSLPGMFDRWFNDAKDFAIRKLLDLAMWITGLPGRLIDRLRNLGPMFHPVGRDIANGVWSGITAGWDWLTGQVGNLARRLLNAAKSALGIASPSKLFRDQIGKWIPAGAAEGVEDNTGVAVNAVRRMAGNLLSASAPSFLRNASGLLSRSSGSAAAAVQAGDTFVTVILDDQPIKAVIRKEMSESNRALKRGVLAGSGAVI